MSKILNITDTASSGATHSAWTVESL